MDRRIINCLLQRQTNSGNNNNPGSTKRATSTITLPKWLRYCSESDILETDIVSKALPMHDEVVCCFSRDHRLPTFQVRHLSFSRGYSRRLQERGSRRISPIPVSYPSMPSDCLCAPSLTHMDSEVYVSLRYLSLRYFSSSSSSSSHIAPVDFFQRFSSFLWHFSLAFDSYTRASTHTHKYPSSSFLLCDRSTIIRLVCFFLLFQCCCFFACPLLFQCNILLSVVARTRIETEEDHVVLVQFMTFVK